MTQWDYIVVGAGSAGAALAARLSEDPSCKVLLLEAGGSDRGLQVDLVAMAPFRLQFMPGYDWMYMSEPDPSRLGRSDRQARGKMLGGSSSTNGTVYVRGNRDDYDHWAQLGNLGWDYDSMLEIFHRLEDGHGDLANSSDYGHGGPIRISESRGRHPLTDVFIAAMAELGVPTDLDYNHETQFSAGVMRVNQYRGKRWGTGRGYLRPARSRPNLAIVTHAEAKKILFEGCRAVGVEYDRNGKLEVARCGGEVILSAGVFNTPKLLMLSGIGDAAHLAEFGINVVHENRHVGLNLHDHPAQFVMANVKGRTTNQENNLVGRLKLGLQYFLFGSGDATHHWPGVAFVKTEPSLEYPDVQFHFGPFIRDYTPEGVFFPKTPGICLLATLTRPRSRGEVRLRSADPQEPPVIRPNLLSDPYDVDKLIDAVQFARRVLATRAFAPHIVSERTPGADVTNRNDLEDWIRQTTGPAYHSVGTAKMGIDDTAVVDPSLRVIGVEGLRVADASIIPRLPSGNTNAISIAIGEKAADLIRDAA